MTKVNVWLKNSQVIGIMTKMHKDDVIHALAVGDKIPQCEAKDAMPPGADFICAAEEIAAIFVYETSSLEKVPS